MHPRKLVDGIEKLVSLPDVCVKVNRLADSPSYSAAAVGEIIVQDTDLSARLLRLVNSAFFGMQVPVDTISRAVTLIGTHELRNLVMASVAARVFTGGHGGVLALFGDHGGDRTGSGGTLQCAPWRAAVRHGRFA